MRVPRLRESFMCGPRDDEESVALRHLSFSGVFVILRIMIEHFYFIEH
jgi:hypothetical protein